MDAITNQGFGSLGPLAACLLIWLMIWQPVAWLLRNLSLRKLSLSKLHLSNIVVGGLLALISLGENSCAVAAGPAAGAASAGPAAAGPGRKIRHVLFYDGQPREFSVYLPSSFSNFSSLSKLEFRSGPFE